MSHAEPSPWASIEETAAFMGLSRATVYRLIGRGQITSTHVGRRHLIDLRSVDRLLEGPEATVTASETFACTDEMPRTPADAHAQAE